MDTIINKMTKTKRNLISRMIDKPHSTSKKLCASLLAGVVPMSVMASGCNGKGNSDTLNNMLSNQNYISLLESWNNDPTSIENNRFVGFPIGFLESEGYDVEAILNGDIEAETFAFTFTNMQKSAYKNNIYIYLRIDTPMEDSDDCKTDAYILKYKLSKNKVRKDLEYLMDNNYIEAGLFLQQLSVDMADEVQVVDHSKYYKSVGKSIIDYYLLPTDYNPIDDSYKFSHSNVLRAVMSRLDSLKFVNDDPNTKVYMSTEEIRKNISIYGYAQSYLVLYLFSGLTNVENTYSHSTGTTVEMSRIPYNEVRTYDDNGNCNGFDVDARSKLVEFDEDGYYTAPDCYYFYSAGISYDIGYYKRCSDTVTDVAYFTTDCATYNQDKFNSYINDSVLTK